MEFSVPRAPRLYSKVLGNFLGVDFTSISPIERRASNMINLVNNNGYLETRPGYAQIGDTLDGPINGVWNIDEDTNIFVVHAGTKLYKLDLNFENAVLLFETLNDKISKGFYMNNHLIVFDGKRAIVYGKFGNQWTAKYLDEAGYVPTTAVSRSPDGVNSVKFEDLNLISKYRINSFLSDGVANTYKLDAENIDDETIIITQLMANGTLGTRTDFTVDRVSGEVVFTEVPATSPVDGRDNIFIRFAKTNTEHLSYINKCTIGTLYGYDGNDNRLFVSGNPEFPNIDWFSKDNDVLYFPISNYTQIGYQPIVAYSKLNDGTLAIHKAVSDTDNTVYYRHSALYGGKEVFPIKFGVKSVGCITPNASANLVNDPLILTNEGVYGIIGSQQEEKFAMDRGYFIKEKLIKEPNLTTAVAIAFRGKYYLSLNNKVYVADSRYKSEVEDALTQDYQYEWYYWENVPVRIWFQYNNELYFGTSSGKIVKFNDTCLDFDVPISCYFETTFLNLGSITESKTVRNVSVITKPKTKTRYELGYITDEETSPIVVQTYNADDFMKTLQEKEKIKKFMFVKFYLKNNTNTKMNFYQIALQYLYSGKYRGD